MTTRTFLALPLTEGNRQELVALLERLKRGGLALNWAHPDDLHLTLAFLGDVATDALPGLFAAVAAAVGPCDPFQLELVGLGAFPNPTRPRVLWAGVGVPGLDALLDLRRRVAEAATAAGLAPADDRFHPHITLGYVKDRPRRSPDLGPIIERRTTWGGGVVPVAEVVTFATMPVRQGPRYRALARAGLGSMAREADLPG